MLAIDQPLAAAAPPSATVRHSRTVWIACQSIINQSDINADSEQIDSSAVNNKQPTNSYKKYLIHSINAQRHTLSHLSACTNPTMLGASLASIDLRSTPAFHSFDDELLAHCRQPSLAIALEDRVIVLEIVL